MTKYNKKTSLLAIIIASVVISACLVMCLEPAAKRIYTLNYRDEIEEISHEYNLDPYLVMGIISAESGFREDAKSHKSAHGLMQIKDETAFWCIENLGIEAKKEDVRKPEINIRIGCAYMRYLVDLYGGNIPTAIAAYNAGLGNVNKWLGDKRYSDGSNVLTDIPFGETDSYVKKVQKRTEIYRKIYKQ